jgi:ankyrin repeat protein
LFVDARCKSNDVNGNVSGFRALEMAVSVDDDAATRVLLANGADASLRFPTGTSALHLACLMNSESIVTMLIAAHADVNACDDDKVQKTNASR